MNTQPIITLSQSALSHIRKTILKQQPAIGFRLAIKKTGCSGYAYVTDIVNQVSQDDIKVDCEDVLIFVDKSSASFLQGTLIDFVDQGLGQTKLIFNNPNAANLCGCGESFNLAGE